MGELKRKLQGWWRLRQARRAAKKYQLDFEHRCCWRHQLEYVGLEDGSGEIVFVPMKSGKTARYKATSERYNHLFTDTGQKNWKFEFQGYL